MDHVLVTGAQGMLGRALVEELSPHCTVTCVDIGEFDITDPELCVEAIRSAAPGIVVNCAAYTDVDRAEADAERAHAVNAIGAANVAKAAARAGARVIQISTDYVFDGTKQRPYEVDDPPAPLSVYGASKLAGERAVMESGAPWLIVRTSWLYGHHGPNFVETIIRAAVKRGALEVVDDQGRVRNTYNPPYGAVIHVRDGDAVEPDQLLFEWDIYNTPIITERNGTVRFGDIKERVTIREEVDENSGKRSQVIIDDKDKVLQPHIDILGAAGQRLARYLLPTGAILNVKDGDKVSAGEALARIRRDISKTRDITGGLPRVAELFEARKPKDAAAVTEIDGTVSFGGITRGMRKVVVTNDNGDTKEYLVPQGKHLQVQEGDTVRAGDALTEGPINPHDILRIKGIKEAQEYLVEEIQEVYRLQGVRIDDKHIETVVRQMLQKVRIEDPGDSPLFLEGDQVDKIVLREENERIEKEGGQPATFTPLLLGITKASLSTQSFISAASFQETTRILTEAAIRGSVDYLRGLKENVTIGNLIPAGTGVSKYRKLHVYGEDADLEEFLEKEEPTPPPTEGMRTA